MAYGTLNAGVIAPGSGESLSITLGSSAGDDFNVDSGKLLVEGYTGRVSTSATGTISENGSCFHSSTNRNLVFGY